MRDIRWISTHPDGGQIHGMIDAVFPILKQRDKNQWGVMGTGFFVTHFGLFFTAAHVFYGRDIVTDRDQLFIPHMLLEERSYILRRIVWAYGHDVTDIAVGMAEPISMHENGEAIINRALLLVAETPSVGETVFSYGHPCTEVIPYMQDIDYLALLHLFTTEGIVQQHFPNGRDSIVQPGCCIETNLLSYGGSSGSPVMDSHGRVFAVISSGLGENITYAAPIADILNTEIPVFFENNPHRINRVRDCLPFGGMAPTRGDGE